jgi:hypothetical protein
VVTTSRSTSAIAAATHSREDATRRSLDEDAGRTWS